MDGIAFSLCCSLEVTIIYLFIWIHWIHIILYQRYIKCLVPYAKQSGGLYYNLWYLAVSISAHKIQPVPDGAYLNTLMIPYC